MRSCNKAAHCARSSVFRLPESDTAMPRSMRSMCAKPQLCAMSVALDDHGEIVPMRGVIKKRLCVASGVFTRSAESKAFNCNASASDSGASDATKYQYSLAIAFSGSPSDWAFCSNLLMRKAESAVSPRKAVTTGMVSIFHQTRVGKKGGLYARLRCWFAGQPENLAVLR